jgi:hemerythrin
MKTENQLIEYMQWRPDLETGISVIDNQHRRIVDYINQLEKANRTGNRALSQSALDGLVDYTSTHFEFEEELLERSGYSFLGAHQKIHRTFMKRIKSFVARSESNEDVTPELLNMLKVWLISHIKGDDQDYVDAVKNTVVSANDELGDWMTNTLKRLFG